MINSHATRHGVNLVRYRRINREHRILPEIRPPS
jgi:hypothetical protein